MGFQKKAEEPKAATVVIEAPVGNAEAWKRILALSKTLDEKHSRKHSLIRLGAKVGELIPSICTGLPTFDYTVLQTGGVPDGRIVELFGPESSGKTSIALHVIGENQKAGKIAAFVDAEHALDPTYAMVLGVDVDNLVINQPDSGEQALQVVDALVDSRAVNLIVIDSVAALVPEAELAGEIGDSHVGLQARMMSQACRILTGKCSRNGVTLIFINQIREKIGVMYGNPETTTGGRALKFYSSVRIDVRRKEKITGKNADDIIGHEIRLKAVKNKCGVPFRETTINLSYTEGFDKISDMITYAAKRGLFETSGSWYSIGGEKIANGLPNLKLALKERPELIERVKVGIAKVLAADAEAAKG
jgi:recombination protein RecA